MVASTLMTFAAVALRASHSVAWSAQQSPAAAHAESQQQLQPASRQPVHKPQMPLQLPAACPGCNIGLGDLGGGGEGTTGGGGGGFGGGGDCVGVGTDAARAPGGDGDSVASGGGG